MWSPSLTAFLLAALIARQAFSADENADAEEPEAPCPGICRPSPNAGHLGCRSTCTFEETEDRDDYRWPAVIYHYSCFCPGKLCSLGMDFRCTQITRYVQVYYHNDPGRATLKSVNTSCVCAVRPSTPANNCCDRIADQRAKRRQRVQHLQCLNTATNLREQCDAHYGR
uniref:Putative conserved secreted protein ovary overexpressed n=1 Tax=Rhipicephalus microplus TaxID=6941 RepID=A0A6M2CU86_RHIMP